MRGEQPDSTPEIADDTPVSGIAIGRTSALSVIGRNGLVTRQGASRQQNILQPGRP